MKKDKKIFEINEKYRQYLLKIDFEKMLDDEVIAKKFMKKTTAITMLNGSQYGLLQEKLIAAASKQRKIYLLGQAIKRAREDRRMSATTLGEQSKLSPSLISKIESGKSYLPKVSSLVSIAKALKVNSNIFIEIIKEEIYTPLHEEPKISWEKAMEGILRELGIKGSDLDLVIEFIRLVVSQTNKRHDSTILRLFKDK